MIAPLATQRNSWRRELSKGEAGAFVDGFLNLAMGAVIVGFHNTWSGLPVVLTLVGWCLLIKSMIRFFAPTQALRIMSRVSLERSWEFQVAGGAGFLALASLLGYALYAGWQSMVKQTCGAQRRRLSVPHRPFRHGSAILPDSP